MIVEGTIKTIVLGTVRHAITAAATAYGVDGFIGSDNTQAIIGGLVTAINIAWFVIDKKRNSYTTPLMAKAAVDKKVAKKLRA